MWRQHLLKMILKFIYLICRPFYEWRLYNIAVNTWEESAHVIFVEKNGHFYGEKNIFHVSSFSLSAIAVWQELLSGNTNFLRVRVHPIERTGGDLIYPQAKTASDGKQKCLGRTFLLDPLNDFTSGRWRPDGIGPKPGSGTARFQADSSTWANINPRV